MIKNTASQRVGAQMVSATDGSAFTGSVTVSVTGDAGTQATGSVGAGACAHEGNGYHTYAPAQAETNYDLIAFTFTGTGAVPATVQVYTITGDAFARLGAPAGASVSADILTIDNLVDDLESRLGTPSNFGSGATVAANLVDIEGQTDDIGVAGAGLTNINLPDQAMNITGDITGNLSGSVGSVAAGGITASSFGAGAIDAAAIAAGAIGASELAADAVAEIADAVWDEDATAHQTQGTFGQAIGDPVADANTIFKAVVTDATGATVGVDVVAVKAETVSILDDTDDIGVAGAGLSAVPWNASWDAEVQSEVQDALDATLADSVPADGTRPSLAQAIYMINQFLSERAVSGTTVTVKKVDGSSSLMTFTINDATSPTSITRAT